LSTVISFDHVTKLFSIERGRPRSFKEAFVAAFHGERRRSETLVALDDVSFVLEQGGTLGLVGPNGTGKSTVLKLMARILEPTSGTVAVRGRVAALLELGAGFHPDLSGRENIMLNGSMMGFGRREMRSRLDRIVEFSELERFIDMPVKHYSSGMYMRLGFATAIHMDAETLLVDEVLAVGDQAFQNKCRDRIAELRKSGVSIVFVSHDSTQVRELCREALWLEGGTVRAYGPTDTVLEAYHSSVMEREEARFASEHDKEVDHGPSEGDRWGSREVEIVAVDLLDAQGKPVYVVNPGSDVTIRVRYNARQVVESPVFGLAIHRNDGLHVNGPNTLDAGLDIERVYGPGAIYYRIPSLPLLSGTYEVSASCYDRSCTHPYDHHHRAYPFRVRAGSVREQLGMVWIQAEWTHEPEDEPGSRDPAAGPKSRESDDGPSSGDSGDGPSHGDSSDGPSHGDEASNTPPPGA
jgi:lipopolysaccharide transport system ATP-binding protein